MDKYKSYIDADGNSLIYIKHETVRSIPMILEEAEAYGILATDTDNPETMLMNLAAYEASREYRYKKREYQTIQGHLFTALLPHGEYTEKTKKKVIRKFVEYFRGEEKNLKYLAWEEVRGQGRYLKVYMTDRQYVINHPIRYKTDRYVHKDTKKWVKKDDEGAVLKIKKGSLKEYITGWLQTKSRIFYNPDAEVFRQRLQDCWKQACNSINAFEKGDFIFERKKINEEMNRYLKREYIHQNHLMTYIENQLNELNPIEYYESYECQKEGIPKGTRKETSLNQKLRKIFEHYKARFRNNVFHVERVAFKLQGRADLIDANLKYLRQIFDEEIRCFKEETSLMEN